VPIVLSKWEALNKSGLQSLYKVEETTLCMKYAVNLFHCLNCVPWFVIISTVINVLFVLVSLILAKLLHLHLVSCLYLLTFIHPDVILISFAKNLFATNMLILWILVVVIYTISYCNSAYCCREKLIQNYQNRCNELVSFCYVLSCIHFAMHM